MLHFILGIAGTGKTINLINKMRDASSNFRRVIYLVPEQYSFEAERQMHRQLGDKLALNVEVLSFTRLCNHIFRKYGGLAGVPLTKTAKYLLMSIAVDEVRDNLVLYRKSCANVDFLDILIQTCGEFKTAGITCTALTNFAASCEDAALQKKLSELSVIYTAYQGIIDRGYVDPDDDLLRACELLENNSFFYDAIVFVDGFTTFMAAEFELLGHIIMQSDDVYFAMTADGVVDDQRGAGVFSAAKSAIGKLERLARDNGADVAEPEILTEPVRFLRPELAYIAENFMHPATAGFDGEYTGALDIFSAAGIYDELDMVAAGISRLVREKGVQYREIAVVARNAEPYSRALETAFSRYDIPYFLGVSEDIENKPLSGCVLAAINAVRSGFDTDNVMLFAKSPLLGLQPDELGLLENYCYCWDVRGALWHSDFANNPRGLAGAMDTDDIAALESINATRIAIITPLLELRDAMRQSDGLGLAKGVFDLLTGINAVENLTKYAESLEQRDTFLDESAQLWDLLMEVLDIFGSVLGSYKMPVPRLCELFKLALGTAEIAMPPQTLDQVLVGCADRIRPEKLRAVFVIGANENIFPAQMTGSGVFSDAERNLLIDAGLEISAPSLQKTALEKYFAYFALTLPSEYLHVTFPRQDMHGREMLPSAIIIQLNELFSTRPEHKRDLLEGIYTETSAFDMLSKNYLRDTELSATLHEFFADGLRSKALERMFRARLRPAHKITDEAAAKAIFGTFMRLSPSRVERFYKCPFSYFASDGLKLRARYKVEFTGLESGSVIHHVLQSMLQKHGGKGIFELSDKELADEISEIIREYLSGRIDSQEKLPARLRFLFKRLSGMLARLLRRLGEEFSQSEFVPLAFELPIKQGEKVEAMRLETVDGTSVIVEGIVDRVDVMNKNGRKYVRVVDYKSGIKSFELYDVLYGLNMQMLLYLFTIAENGVDELSNLIPAGVLYMPAREKYVSASRDSDGESVGKLREKEWRMSGLLLDDEDILRGMERDIAGVYIPAKLNRHGKLDAASSLASRAELGRLARKVKERITDMAELLTSGMIEACPCEENERLFCNYCDYNPMCGHDTGDTIKSIYKLNRDDVFKLLAKEEQDGTSAMDKSAE